MSGKKFQFSLSNVLKLRQHEAERAREALVRAARRSEQQAAHVEAMRLRLQEVAGSAPRGGIIDLNHLRRHEALRREAQRSYERACRDLDRLRQEEHHARERLVGRHRDQETLQTLRDQEHERFVQDRAQAEMTFLDEQAMISFHKKRQASYA